MGGECSAYGGKERLIQGLGGETDLLVDPGINGMDLQEVGCGVLDHIDLAQDRDRLQALVNVAMNL